MKWTKKSERYNMDYSLKSRYKNHKLTVSYSSVYKYFFFLVEYSNAGYVYNSLWDRLKFKTEEECIKACIDYVDTRVGK